MTLTSDGGAMPDVGERGRAVAAPGKGAPGGRLLFGDGKSGRAECYACLQAAALEVAGDAVAIIGADGRIQWVNAAFTDLSGRGAEEAIGQAFASGWADADGTSFPRNLREILARGGAWRGEAVGRRKDGGVYTEEQTITAVRDEGGGILHLVATLRDITEAKRAEKTLRESEKRMRLYYDLPFVGMAIASLDMGWIQVNDKLCAMLGYSRGELAGMTWTELTHPEDLVAEVREFDRILAGDSDGYSMDKRFIRKDGGTIYTSVAMRCVRRDDGAIDDFLAVVQDITERKHAEEELRRHREARMESEKMAAMGQLLAGVAHELNNPLSVVIGHLELLKKAVTGEPERARVEKIEKAAERSARIVRNFLGLARQHPPERQRVALSRIIEEALELLAYSLRVDGVEVSLDLAEEAPLLWADPDQLHQVLVNLLTNAHQALRQTDGSRRLTITTRFDRARARVSLAVANTGPGIPLELQQRIFEPFFTTKPVGEGTGLGLSLCKGFIESHKGTISVESGPGQGAVFTVELPVESPPVVVPDARAGEAVPPILSRSILVVDDEVAVGSVLAEMLTVEGHRVETATNGALALDKLREGAYDLVLTDVRMPELDGPGLYEKAGSLDPGLRRRFIFLTGDTLSAHTSEFLERRGLPSLSKPFTAEELQQVVQRVLRGQELGAAVAPPRA